MANVLVIGDIHEPAAHPKYLRFCQDLQEEWECDRVIMIGDIMDWEAISFHSKNPHLPSAGDEYKLTRRQVQKWYKAFPDAEIMIGNHDDRPFRLGRTVNIPDELIKDQNTLWQTPKWRWMYEKVFESVYYFHGTGHGGLYPAINKAKSIGMSVVMGHCHSVAGYQWTASPIKRFFGMSTGCGIDIDKMQFEYGKNHIRRPILGAGLVLDGKPYHEIMPCGKGERYYKHKK